MPHPRARLQYAAPRGGLGQGLNLTPPSAPVPEPVVVQGSPTPQNTAPDQVPATNPAPAAAAAPVDTYVRETCNYTEVLERGTNRVVNRSPRPGFRPCSVGMSVYSSLYDEYAVYPLNQWSTQIRLPYEIPVRLGASATFNVGAGLVAGLHATVTPEQRLVDFPNLQMLSWAAGITLVDRQGPAANGFRPTNEFGLEVESTHIASVDATLSPESIADRSVVRLNLVNRGSPLAFQVGPVHLGIRLNSSPVPLVTLADGGSPQGRLDGQSVSDLYVLRAPFSFVEFFANYDFNHPSTSTNISASPLSGNLTTADRVNTWLLLSGLTMYKVFGLQNTTAYLVNIASARNDAVAGGNDYAQLEHAALFLPAANGGTTTRNIINYSSWYLHNGNTADRAALLIAAGLEMSASAALGFIAPDAFGLDYYEPWASAARMNFFQDIGQSILVGVDLARDSFNYAERRRLNNPRASSLFGVGAGAGLVLGGGLVLALTRGGYPAANPILGASSPQAVLEENIFRAERNISVATIGYTAIFNGIYYIISDLLLSHNEDLSRNQPPAARNAERASAIDVNHPDAVYLRDGTWSRPSRHFISGFNAAITPIPGGAAFRFGLNL